MIRTVNISISRRALTQISAASTLLGAALLLPGCSSSGTGGVMKDTAQTLSETQREVDRTFREPFQNKEPLQMVQKQGVLGPAAKPVDPASIKLAIDRFAEARKQKAGTYVVTGAVLTPDGKTRALILFTSENWCQPQGCELAIFEQGTFGWKSVGTINRVRPPVRVTAAVSNGWHDLWVVTGREEGGKNKKSFIENVRLQYGSNGYPSTTTFAIATTKGAPEGQVIIETADLDVPDKARFATGGREPGHGKKKIKELTPAAAAK
jgi:hypothetical protein